MKRFLLLFMVVLLLVSCFTLTAFASSTSSEIQNELDADADFMTFFEKLILTPFGDLPMWTGNAERVLQPGCILIEWAEQCYFYGEATSVQQINGGLEDDVAALFEFECEGVFFLNDQIISGGIADMVILIPSEPEEVQFNLAYVLSNLSQSDGSPVPLVPDELPQKLIVYGVKDVVLYTMGSSSVTGPSYIAISDSMSSVMEWVGTVTTSLLSGELSPLLLLLAIPIAISLIFLAIKAIKMVFNL